MILSGTGHRPDKLGGYTKEAAAKLRVVATSALLQHKPETVISGMALGWDTALAQAAISLNIPLIAAIPFEGQESRWPKESQDMFNRILAKASSNKFVCGPGCAVWKMQKRNEGMVDNSDAVLAIWNGTNDGTASCIKRAEEVRKPVYNQWEMYNGR